MPNPLVKLMGTTINGIGKRQGRNYSVERGVLEPGNVAQVQEYRHQILAVKQLTPTQLFLAVKLVECLYHLHPRRLWRALTVADPQLRRQLRRTFRHTAGVFLYEIGEHLADRIRGSLAATAPVPLPEVPTHQQRTVS